MELGSPPKRHEKKRRRRHEQPPLPEGWRPLSSVDRGPSHLAGAGLALYGLRTVPVVNWDPERDRLCAALGWVARSKRPRLVLLRRPRGCGKSCLARWIGERAHDLGAGTILQALHGSRPGADSGLAGMVRRHYRCTGLAPEATRERLERCLRREHPPYAEEVAALSALIAPDDDGGRTGRVAVRFGSARERHLVVGRMLERACRERPAVVWLDDVQWGSDALAFAKFILELPLLEVGDRFLLANCTRERGALHLDRGAWVEATRCLVRARDAFVLAGDWTRLGVTPVGLSELFKRQGLLFEAAEELHAARRCFARSGFRFGVAECINHLSDGVRLQGELAWAEGLCAESRARFTALGAPNAAVPTTLGRPELISRRWPTPRLRR